MNSKKLVELEKVLNLDTEEKSKLVVSYLRNKDAYDMLLEMVNYLQVTVMTRCTEPKFNLLKILDNNSGENFDRIKDYMENTEKGKDLFSYVHNLTFIESATSYVNIQLKGN
jgi:hypothetical protein